MSGSARTARGRRCRGPTPPGRPGTAAGPASAPAPAPAPASARPRCPRSARCGPPRPGPPPPAPPPAPADAREHQTAPRPACRPLSHARPPPAQHVRAQRQHDIRRRPVRTLVRVHTRTCARCNYLPPWTRDGRTLTTGWSIRDPEWQMSSLPAGSRARAGVEAQQSRRVPGAPSVRRVRQPGRGVRGRRLDGGLGRRCRRDGCGHRADHGWRWRNRMAVLTDAELVLGLSRHLSAYTMGPERAALGELEFAGWVFDVAFRLRGSTTSPARRVRAIGLDVGLSNRNLREVMTTLETM